MGVDKGILNAISEHKDKMKKPHFIFSAERPTHSAHNELQMSHNQILHHLNHAGYDAHPINEKYGSSKKSIIVYGVNPQQADDLHKLASKLGQDSSMYSNGKGHELRYHHGTNAGKSHYGKATTWHEKSPNDNFSSLPGNLDHFTHHVDSNNHLPSGQLGKGA